MLKIGKVMNAGIPDQISYDLLRTALERGVIRLVSTADFKGTRLAVIADGVTNVYPLASGDAKVLNPAEFRRKRGEEGVLYSIMEALSETSWAYPLAELCDLKRRIRSQIKDVVYIVTRAEWFVGDGFSPSKDAKAFSTREMAEAFVLKEIEKYDSNSWLAVVGINSVELMHADDPDDPDDPTWSDEHVWFDIREVVVEPDNPALLFEYGPDARTNLLNDPKNCVEEDELV